MRTTFVLFIPLLMATACSRSGTNSDLSSISCDYPQWVRGQFYNPGDKVIFNGQAYVAEHGNPGYDPTISTWYWEPTSCSGGSSGSATSCSGTPVWQARTPYEAGALVVYNGKKYRAAHANPGYDPVISHWYWEDLGRCQDAQTPAPQPAPAPSPGPSPAPSPNQGASGFRSILNEAQFQALFPNRLPFYTYEGLASAIDSYPGFAKEGSLDVRKREVAAFLANIEHESGHLQYVEEINRANWPLYCDRSNTVSPCAPGKQYYGRGPMQLSWNYNYGAAARVIGVDILANPDLVAQDSKIAWQTALWFWMTQTGAGTMTAHSAIVNGAGFGETIRTINGSLECGGRNPTQVQARINYFNRIANALGVSVGERTGC
jgi:predicted chitinase